MIHPMVLEVNLDHGGILNAIKHILRIVYRCLYHP